MTSPTNSATANAGKPASSSATPPAPSGRRKLITLVVLLALLGVLAVIVISRLDSRLRLTKPDGFAEVGDEARSRQFVQKLISPDGTVIAVRRFDNPDPETGLAYWSQALELEKTQNDGMVLVSREDIATTTGEKGLLFDFEVGERPAHIRYLIALYVMGDAIYTVEAGGRPDAITASRDAIVTAMKTLGD